MSTGWDNYEPAPLEYFHGKLHDYFHEFRLSKTESTEVLINGSDLAMIIAKAKKDTKAKYPNNILPHNAIPKTEFK